MTEKKAWLKIAEMFDSDGPLPEMRLSPFPFIGLCHGTVVLRRRGDISYTREDHMDRVMFAHFRYDNNPNHPFVWPKDASRVSRTLRATACCFLAAMCDD